MCERKRDVSDNKEITSHMMFAFVIWMLGGLLWVHDYGGG